VWCGKHVEPLDPDGLPVACGVCVPYCAPGTCGWDGCGHRCGCADGTKCDEGSKKCEPACPTTCPPGHHVEDCECVDDPDPDEPDVIEDTDDADEEDDDVVEDTDDDDGDEPDDCDQPDDADDEDDGDEDDCPVCDCDEPPPPPECTPVSSECWAGSVGAAGLSPAHPHASAVGGAIDFSVWAFENYGVKDPEDPPFASPDVAGRVAAGNAIVFRNFNVATFKWPSQHLGDPDLAIAAGGSLDLKWGTVHGAAYTDGTWKVEGVDIQKGGVPAVGTGLDWEWERCAIEAATIGLDVPDTILPDGEVPAGEYRVSAAVLHNRTDPLVFKGGPTTVFVTPDEVPAGGPGQLPAWTGTACIPGVPSPEGVAVTSFNISMFAM